MTTELRTLCEQLGIRAEVEHGNDDALEPSFVGSHPWTVRLVRGKGSRLRTLTVPFWTGSANSSEPDAADVLSCLVSDARLGEQSFEGFCSDMGESTDSRRAERIWKACRKSAPWVREFLGDDFEHVEGAEH